MIGEIQSKQREYRPYTAGAAISFGQFVYLNNTTGEVHPITDNSKPIFGIVVKTPHDYETDGVSSGNTAHVLFSGDVEVKKKAGFTPGGEIEYNTTTREISDAGYPLMGVSVSRVIDDTTVVIRVVRAMSIQPAGA